MNERRRDYIFFPSKALGTEAEERREEKEVYIVNYNLFTISYIWYLILQQQQQQE